MPSRPLPPPLQLPDPSDLIAAPAARGARLICRHLTHLADAAADRLDADGDDAIRARHHLRVALRRLRVTLDAYAPVLEDTVSRKLARRAHALARRLAAARERDALAALLHDVLPTQPGDARARAAMLALLDEQHETDNAGGVRRRWRRLSAALHESLAVWHETHNIGTPSVVTPFSDAAASAIERAARRMQRRVDEISGSDDVVGIHAARLTLKSVRYLLAPLARGDDAADRVLLALRTAQERLGAINDVHALRLRVREWSTRPAALRQRVALRTLESCEAELATRIAADAAAALAWRDAAEHDAIASQVYELCARWRRDASPPREIERKWLLTAVPPRVRGLTPNLLVQGYLPGSTLVERIRCVTTGDGAEQWIRTVKTGRGIARVEIEEATSESIGRALFALTPGKRVEKRRYTVHDGDFAWEIDEFTDRDLVLAECELPDIATAVTPPVWLAPYIVREVTDEKAFTNWMLAR